MLWCVIRGNSHMSDADQPTNLDVHTIETLCDELVSGRAVLVAENERPFLFESTATRSVFEWYRRNPTKWAQRNTKDDVESIVVGRGMFLEKHVADTGRAHGYGICR